jgi:hypothetical protein
MNTKFLECAFIIAVTGLLNTACKKTDGIPPVYYTTLKVLELKTNLPIDGAEVKIYECKRHDFLGCSQSALLQTLTTDKDGSFRFDSKPNVYMAEASHDNYWSGWTGGYVIGESNPLPVTNIHLIPVAYTKIHLKKINSHSPGLFLDIEVKPDSSAVPFFGWSINSFDQPADTTVVVPSYGYCNNIVHWYFTDGPGNIDSSETRGQRPGYYISRFDTAFVELNY